MTKAQSSLVKLRAETPQALKIISACLQDSLFPATAMTYDSDHKVFTVLANRFMWEKDAILHEGKPIYQRVHSGVYFGNVKQIKHWNIDRNDATNFLNLMAVYGDKQGEIHLVFSDNKQICLQIDDISCHLKDLHKPWHTHQKPEHPQ